MALFIARRSSSSRFVPWISSLRFAPWLCLANPAHLGRAKKPWDVSMKSMGFSGYPLVNIQKAIEN